MIGTVLGTQYASRAGDAFAPLPPEFPADAAKESVVAADSILDQIAAQGTIPLEQIEAVRIAAFEAYLGSSRVTMLISTAAVVIAVFVVGLLLPKIQPPQKGDKAPADTWDEPEEITQEEIRRTMHLDEEP